MAQFTRVARPPEAGQLGPAADDPDSEAFAEATQVALAAEFFALDQEMRADEEARQGIHLRHGRRLLRIQQGGLWAAGGHDSFEAYLLTFRWSRATALAWMDAARAADRLLHPDPPTATAPAPAPLADEATVAQIGVTNLAQLGRALKADTPPGEAADLVAQAHDLTTLDFKRALRDRAGTAASARADYLEETALALRDLSATLVTTPEAAEATLRTISDRALNAVQYLADLAAAPVRACPECGGALAPAGPCTRCGVIPDA